MSQSSGSLRAYVALEAAILGAVWTGMRAPFQAVRASGLTYSADSLLGVLGMVLLAGAIPEVFLHHLLLGNSVAAFVLDALVLYATAWCFGIYGCMVHRPHAIRRDHIILNNGPFATLVIPTAAIAALAPCIPPTRKQRRTLRATAHFLLGAKKAVEIEFAQPAQVQLLPYLPAREVRRIIVGSDRPDDFCARVVPLLKQP